MKIIGTITIEAAKSTLAHHSGRVGRFQPIYDAMLENVGKPKAAVKVSCATSKEKCNLASSARAYFKTRNMTMDYRYVGKVTVILWLKRGQ